MNISAVSTPTYAPPVKQLQSAKSPVPAVAAAPERPRDADTDKVGQPDTNDRTQGSVGGLLNAKA